jgi:predicted CoA-binding protein
VFLITEFLPANCYESAKEKIMATYRASFETIEDFLAENRIAMVGVSREPKGFSRMLFEELSKRGYDMVPVNPNAPEVLGRPCFAL